MRVSRGQVGRVHAQGAGGPHHVADGVVGLMSLYVDEYFATGEVPKPGHNILTGRYACYDVYRCADDKWIAVGAIGLALRAIAGVLRHASAVQSELDEIF